jgi:hypothetical protein
MILFYSVFCNHCKMLLEHLKRYDKEKIIKLVSIDELRSKNMNIESKIHSVPAFMILPSKEILFGKAVFDHLLLPGRGILCSTQSTRLDKSASGSGTGTGTSDSDVIPLTNTSSDKEDEPLAFTLNTASFSDNFSIIENDTQELNDKNYNWDFITNDANISDGIKNISAIAATAAGAAGAAGASSIELGGSGRDDGDGSTMTKSEKTNQSLEELKRLRDTQKF